MTSKMALKKPFKIRKSGFWQKSPKTHFRQAGIGLKPVSGPLKSHPKSTCNDPSDLTCDLTCGRDLSRPGWLPKDTSLQVALRARLGHGHKQSTRGSCVGYTLHSGHSVILAVILAAYACTGQCSPLKWVKSLYTRAVLRGMSEAHPIPGYRPR